MNDNYYDVPALSASGINDFINKGALSFWKHSPLNPDREATPDTPAMKFGRLCHTLVLESHIVDSLYSLEPPDINRRTKAGREEYERFLASSQGKEVVTQKDFDLAKAMADALHADSKCQKLLGQGEPEKPLFWADETGLPCKAKVDYYREGLVIDYKTSNDILPEDFGRKMANLGYHRQAAFYMRAIEITHGTRPDGFVFIVQNKDIPADIHAFALDKESIECGDYEVAEAVLEIHRRIRENDWQPPQQMESVSLPYWYLMKSQQQQGAYYS